MIITHFEDVLSDTGKLGVLLTACLPMLMDTGGNCGAQSSTLVIRGLALGEDRAYRGLSVDSAA